MLSRISKSTKTPALNAFRAMSTSSEQTIDGFKSMERPQLSLFGLHARYANALYSVAAKENKLNEIEKELDAVVTLMDKNKQFAGFLKDPTIPRHSKKEEISQIMSKGKFSKPVTGLFNVLAENGRLPATPGVIDAYKKLLSAYRGEVAAKIISADPLTAAQVKQVEKALNNHIEKGQKLIVTTAVDPEILGGLQVQIGEMFMDLSINTKINKIHQVLNVPV